MKYVKLFEQFEEDIHKICRKYNIRNYTVNPDGSIDVDGHVHLQNIDLDKLPIKFNKVSGYFDISHNQLTSLEGGPKEVGGGFYCYSNKLTTLEGCPKKVGGRFVCSSNRLTTLEGCPKEIDGDFLCHSNKLTTLEGGPKVVRGDFDCNNNKLLKFEGFPDYINGDFSCYFNPIKIIWYLFYDFEKVELLNYYDLLRIEDGKGVLIWDRLVDFLETIKKPQPTEDQIEKIKMFYEIR